MIQNLIIWHSFFENIVSGIQHFYICPDIPVDIIRVLFNFRFSNRNTSRRSQSQQNLAKNIAHFTIQFRSKNPTHFTNLSLLDTENNMLPQHSQKPFWLWKFSSKHVSVWCQKKYLHCTISWRPKTAFLKHFEKKCLYISLYLLQKIFVPET